MLFPPLGLMKKKKSNFLIYSGILSSGIYSDGNDQFRGFSKAGYVTGIQVGSISTNAIQGIEIINFGNAYSSSQWFGFATLDFNGIQLPNPITKILINSIEYSNITWDGFNYRINSPSQIFFGNTNYNIEIYI
jgi:hypothetical protein